MKTIAPISRKANSISLFLSIHSFITIRAFSFVPQHMPFRRLRILNNLHKEEIYGRTCAHPLSALSAEREDKNLGVQEASLEGLGDDHETVGENMAKSVAAWLDSEVRMNIRKLRSKYFSQT